MESNEGIELLTGLFFEKDWFCEVGTDTSDRYIVYVKYMNADTMSAIPDQIFGKQVLVHFISSKTISKDKVVTTIPLIKEPVVLEDNDLEYLITELEHLEKICNSNTMQDIFYEIHDGKNAVTNLSARYPEVRTSLEKLYDKYGFDIIYEELDG